MGATQLMHDSEHRIPAPLEDSFSSSARPGLSFPLGTAVVFFVIVGITAVFSLCYRLQKLRRELNNSSAPIHLRNFNVEIDATPATITSQQQRSIFPKKPAPAAKPNMVASLPVLMPGDEVPKFIAWPCPQVDATPSKQKEAQEYGEPRSQEPKPH